jgi:signal transduction histidine kinase
METRETQFMGKITAGVTHEMKNVLAIIRESAGLMEDIMAVDGHFPHKDKFSGVLARIEEQVKRGVDLSTKLNKFAHTPDSSFGEINLVEAAEDVIALCSRFAMVKGVSLQFQPGRSPVTISDNPLLIQMYLFQCIDLMIEACGPGSSATVVVDGSLPGIVSFSLSASKGPKSIQEASLIYDSPKWRALQETSASFDSEIFLEMNQNLLLSIKLNRSR